ncbi:MAG: cyclase family protein [Defluviitaleaceae bacterium]|nr:cyclase family protein [Defluviitaleaceae bacterium]
MKYIDISHDLTEATPVYPGDAPVSLARVKSLAGDGYTAYELRSGMHAGTHIDAPMHLLPSDTTIGAYEPGYFCGKCAVLDARGKDIIGLTPEYEEKTPENGIVLLHTDFGAYFGHPETYFTRHPVISPELAAFLISKHIKILGMDTPSPDAPPFALHKLLLANGIFVLENLTNLDAVPAEGEPELFAFPLKIAAEASLVRAVVRIQRIVNSE